MEHLFEYLIGGKKMGREKNAPKFGDLRKGDIFYIYNFDIKLNITRSDQRRVDKVIKGKGGRVYFDSTGSDGGRGRSSWPEEKDISIWTINEVGAHYCVATTEPWGQKELMDAVKVRYKIK